MGFDLKLMSNNIICVVELLHSELLNVILDIIGFLILDDRLDTRILATEKQSEQDTIPGVVQPGIHNNNITVSYT